MRAVWGAVFINFDFRDGMPADPRLLRAWLAARSIARGLPAPVDDRGGYRVEIHSDVEVRRWVFPRSDPAIGELARTIEEPRQFIKVCESDSDLRALLPAGWQMAAPSYFMINPAPPIGAAVPESYRLETVRDGAVSAVRLLSRDGEVAAAGYAAETDEAFVYDRIVTAPAHRRKGLGAAVMAALGQAKQRPDVVELLVATEEGRALYERLGWRSMSPYASASREFRL